MKTLLTSWCINQRGAGQAVTVALPDQAEYEPTWKLLGQQPDGTLLPESEKRVGASDRLYNL